MVCVTATHSFQSFLTCTTDYYDDESWWALAMMKAYDITQDTNYLDVPIGIMQDIMSTAVGAPCGGVWWDRPQTAQTAISNSLALNVAAQLAVRTGDSTYSDWATSQWEFISGSGLITSENLVVDGFDSSTCDATGAVYTYNQGSMIGALVSLNKMNGDSSLLDTALNIANAAIDSLTDDNGVLHESGDEAGSLGTDGAAFKGVMARNIQFLAQATGDSGLKDFLDTNAQALWNSRNSQGRFGVVWGVTTDDTDSSSQASALNALVGAAALSS
jgi:predicted alpha-1,6-mannanase (GH76 family)